MTIWLLCSAWIKYLIKQLQKLIKGLTADLKRASFGCFSSLLVVLIQTNTIPFPTVLLHWFRPGPDPVKT